MRVPWAAGLLLLVALAGCADPAPEPAADEDDAFELEATDETGIIRGVVVDDAIVPVANATVTLDPGTQDERVLQTDASGLFGWDALDPGFHMVRVEKVGFQATEVQTTVEAGVDEPPVVRVLLERIPGFEPFYNLFQWDGFIQCNTTVANVCFIINFYPDFLLGTGYITDDDSLHAWYDEFVDVGKHPQHTQIETVWDSTQALGSNLNIRYEVGNIEEDFFIPCVFGSRDTESPQIFRINATMARDAGLGAPDDAPDEEGCDEDEEAFGLVMEFFSGDALGTGVFPVGATVEQRTTTFVAAFYDYAPPADWTFVSGTGVPPPPV